MWFLFLFLLLDVFCSFVTSLGPDIIKTDEIAYGCTCICTHTWGLWLEAEACLRPTRHEDILNSLRSNILEHSKLSWCIFYSPSKYRKLLFLTDFAALSELPPVCGLPGVAYVYSLLVFIGFSWLLVICFIWLMPDLIYFFIVNTWESYIIIFSAILLLALFFKSNFLQDSKV